MSDDGPTFSGVIRFGDDGPIETERTGITFDITVAGIQSKVHISDLVLANKTPTEVAKLVMRMVANGTKKLYQFKKEKGL